MSLTEAVWVGTTQTTVDLEPSPTEGTDWLAVFTIEPTEHIVISGQQYRQVEPATEVDGRWYTPLARVLPPTPPPL